MPFFYFQFERVGLCALSSYIPVKVAPSQNTFFPIIADSQERDVAFVWLSFSGSLSITILNQRSQASLHPPCAQPLQYKHASRIFYLYFLGFYQDNSVSKLLIARNCRLCVFSREMYKC